MRREENIMKKTILSKDEEKERAWIEFSKRHYLYNCFTFFRKSSSEKHLVVVYFIEDDEERLFYIQKDNPMSKSEEEYFVSFFLQREIKLDALRWDFLVGNVFNEWKIKLSTKVKEDRMKILQLYFTSFPGIMEILFKCPGIETIATSVLSGKIEEVNLVGRSPGEILEVPLPMLRAMDDHGVDFLKKPEQRFIARAVYKKWHGMISDEFPLTISQLEYLFMAYQENLCVSPKVFRSVGFQYSENENKLYRVYMENREVIRPYYNCLPTLVPPEMIEKYYRITLDILWQIANIDILNRSLKRVLVHQNRLDGEGVKLLTTVESFLEASAVYKNCLYSYAPKVAFSETANVVLLLENICVEIDMKHNRLVQAFCKSNRMLSHEECDILLKYLLEKGIEID